jgi:hypothetical protein
MGLPTTEAPTATLDGCQDAVMASDEWENSRKIIEAQEYGGESSIEVAATQLGTNYSGLQKRHIVDEWVRFDTCGSHGATIKLTPPLTVAEGEIDIASAIIERSLRSVSGTCGSQEISRRTDPETKRASPAVQGPDARGGTR